MIRNRRRMNSIGLLTTLVLVGACGSDSTGTRPARGDRFVFESRQTRQCEPGTGLTLEASAAKLVDAGIDVLRSMCGRQTGVGFAAVCGGATGELVIHEIRASNVPDAEKLEFHDVETLIDAASGTGYEIVDCAALTPVQ